MCGIAGILSKKKVTTQVLRDISKVIQHRGPDDEGFVLFQENQFISCKGEDTIKELSSFQSIKEQQQFKIGLVHRRLSIIDLNKEGHQPMMDTTKNYTIVFNGEVYNFKELRKELEDEGVIFESNSDTEVVLQAYMKWGENCVDKFIGMWAFAVYNKTKKQLFISRDRFGIKPFYYFHNNEFFAFASEIKALFKIPVIEAVADSQLLSEYVIFGTTSKPFQTLFQDIYEIPSGHNGLYDYSLNTLKISAYYQLELEVGKKRIPTNFEEALVEYGNLFSETVKLHLRSDVPVGSCLSGGLDSSALVTEIVPKIEKEFNTFTAAYKNKEIDESGYAKAVIEGFGNIKAHYIFPNSSDFSKDISKIVYHHDHPFGSASMYAHWEVMKLAGENNMKVLLNGQGADESLGGYSKFAGIYLLDLLKGLRFFEFNREKKLIEANFTKGVFSSIASAIYYHLPSTLQYILRKKERIGYQFLNKEIVNQLKIEVPERGGKNYKDNSFSAFRFGLADLLRNEDRNSMAFSIESRVPYLDHRLVEYSIALPVKYKIKKGWSKYILRKLIETKISDTVVWRKYKMGFLTPQREWKHELNEELMAEIKGMKFPNILDKNAFLRFCETDLKSNAHLSEFWRIYSLLKWIAVFNVKV